MFEYTKLPETVRYDHPCWPGFYVLIVPNANDTERAVYMCHEKNVTVRYLWGVCTQSDGTIEPMEKTVECVHWCFDEYLPDFVKDCCTDEEE